MQYKESLIQHLNQVSPLSLGAEELIIDLCSLVFVRKNENLQAVGQTCKTIYFVNDGVSRIFYYKDGKDVTEYFAFNHDLIIRAESLFTSKPSNKGIQAITDTSFVAISSDLLFSYFEAHRDIERLFTKLVEKSYLDTIQRLESLQFSSAEQRYNELLKKSPTILRDIPLKFIASYLGITQVSLSRIRAGVK